MLDSLVLGSGRSGTSLLAGVIAGTGCYMGEELIAPDEQNPKGYFESWQINLINESILKNSLDVPRNIFGEKLSVSDEQYDQPLAGIGHHWLARVPLHIQLNSSPEIEFQISEAVNKKPFCFKDPRFSYTLPAWRPFLKDTVFLCVFRHPADTVTSILKFWERTENLKSLPMNFDRALEVWLLMYRHIVEIHRHRGQWLFLHFHQLFEQSCLDRIEDFVHAKVDRQFPDLALKRSSGFNPIIPDRVRNLYSKLCELAGYPEKS